MSIVSVSVTIMAHPRRATAAHRLAAQLSSFPVRVVFDPEPDEPPATLRTARLAWTPHTHKHSHHLVLQDDVRLHPNFEQQVAEAVASQPDAILSFFSEWGSYTSHALRIGAYAGYSWISQVDTYIGTQAVAMRTDHAASFAEYLTRQPTTTPDDHAIFDFAQQRGFAHYVSNPNLVDHDHHPSLIGNSPQGARRATVFAPQHIAPAQWWQQRPLLTARRIPAMHWSSAKPITYERPPLSGGPRWNISGPRRAWGPLADDVDQAIKLRLQPVASQLADPRLQVAANDVAAVLCEQLAVSHIAELPGNDPFARQCANLAIASMAPGVLRLLTMPDQSIAWDPLNRTLLGIVREIQETFLPHLDVERVRRQYWG